MADVRIFPMGADNRLRYWIVRYRNYAVRNRNEAEYYLHREVPRQLHHQIKEIFGIYATTDRSTDLHPPE